MGGNETMTKRYTITDDGVTDNLTKKQYTKIKSGDNILDTISFTSLIQIVDLLNEQDQKIKKLKEENRLLDIEDERWVKASEQDEETINKLNKEIEKLTHELYLEKGSAEYYKQLAEEYFEEISKLTYKLNKIRDDIER